MSGMKRIAMIPIDNRPVCYSLAQQIAAIDSEIELLLPPLGCMGDLTRVADVEKIYEWLQDLENIDSMVVTLDTIAYGGLIPSRRSEDSYETIVSRLEKFKELFKKITPNIYAFSSIMRISNNNINEEEKPYWNLYGKRIFDYSYNLHKSRVQASYDSQCKFSCIEKTIPESILEDYLKTRERNFRINRYYLSLVKDKIIDTLVFSKDDCAEFGLNVEEAGFLEQEISKDELNAFVKTGADEIPLSLLARAVSKGKALKIAPVFIEPDFVGEISKYEDVSVKKSVEGQIELAGAEVSNIIEADIVLLVNNFKGVQGEIVMGVGTEPFSSFIPDVNKPFAIADIVFANGADNLFVDALLTGMFKFGVDFERFFGYAAWNTTGNTLGSVISAAVVRFFAKKFDLENFKKLQLTRFLDDWAYQANVRQELKKTSDTPYEFSLNHAMKPFENALFAKLELPETELKYRFPWNRFFEISVEQEKAQ